MLGKRIDLAGFSPRRKRDREAKSARNGDAQTSKQGDISAIQRRPDYSRCRIHVRIARFEKRLGQARFKKFSRNTIHPYIYRCLSSRRGTRAVISKYYSVQLETKETRSRDYFLLSFHFVNLLEAKRKRNGRGGRNLCITNLCKSFFFPSLLSFFLHSSKHFRKISRFFPRIRDTSLVEYKNDFSTPCANFYQQTKNPVTESIYTQNKVENEENEVINHSLKESFQCRYLISILVTR